MRLEEAANPMFAYHQTFHPRFGWIKKGFSAANSDPGVFLAEDATVTLGVGKNMVSAIRFWTSAFHVLERVHVPGNARALESRPTPLGRALLGEENGYDPYFEDLGTLWLLHWHLVSERTDAPVWWLTFNDFPALEFSETQLTEFITDEVVASSWSDPNQSSIDKDVDCLLRMYAPRVARGRQGVDDLLDSPFREMELITVAPGAVGRFRFVRGQKRGLSPELVVYMCLDYVARSEPGARTATLSHLANDPGTPGRLLKLTEDSMLGCFMEVAESFPNIAVTSPAGAPQLSITEDPASLASELLHGHYKRRQPRLPRSRELVAGPSARAVELPSQAKPAPAERKFIKRPRTDSPRPRAAR